MAPVPRTGSRLLLRRTVIDRQLAERTAPRHGRYNLAHPQSLSRNVATTAGFRAVAPPQTPEDVLGIDDPEFIELVDDGALHANVAATYPLERYRDALRHVQNDTRNGKILFVP